MASLQDIERLDGQILDLVRALLPSLGGDVDVVNTALRVLADAAREESGGSEPPAPGEVLEEWARRAGTLARRHPEATLLLAWSAVEGALERRAGPTQRRQSGEGVWRLQTLREEQRRLLGEARQVRNRVAHGRDAGRVDPKLVHRLVELAHDLLAAGDERHGDLEPAGEEPPALADPRLRAGFQLLERGAFGDALDPEVIRSAWR